MRGSSIKYLKDLHLVTELYQNETLVLTKAQERSLLILITKLLPNDIRRLETEPKVLTFQNFYTDIWTTIQMTRSAFDAREGQVAADEDRQSV